MHWNAATWIEMGALDMMRVSTFYKGGITGALKVAHLAEAHGMKAQVHGMGIGDAQLCGAIPNNDFYEQLVISTEQIRGLKNQPELPIVGGYLQIPDEPGLSAEMDWPAVEKSAIGIV